MTVRLALILVTHHSADLLAAFAASLRAARSRAGSALEDVEVIVADSGSTDGTPEAVRQHLPAARLILCGHVGFGAAANRAMSLCAAPWALLCNPDVTFPEGFLADAAAWLSAPPHGVACVAPRLLNPDGSVQPSVGRFPSVPAILRDQARPRMDRKYVAPQPEEPAAIDWASGACLLLNRKAFDSVGGFDEHYFLYVEEVDLQRRLREAGYTVRFMPHWAVTHHHPYASRAPRRGVSRHAARGLLRYFAKFGGPLSLTGYRLAALVSGRLPLREALAPRATILRRPSGPGES